MEEYKIIFMRIREYFRKHPQAYWGKNHIIKTLDDIEHEIDIEKE